MAIEAGATCWTEIEDVLRLSIANSAKFQEWTSTASEAAALARIYLEAVPRPAGKESFTAAEAAALLPLALIMDAENEPFIYNRATQGAFQSYEASSAKSVRFIASLNPANPEQEEIRKFKNIVGTIIEQVNAQGGDDNRMDHFQVSLTQPVTLQKREFVPSLDEVIICEFTFNFEEGMPA